MDGRAERLVGGDTRASLAAKVIGAISDVARPALEDIPTRRVEPADRRLLWLERKHVLAIGAWFNPVGPSVTTLEVCSLPDETDDYLVYFMRHPFAPDYRVVGALGPEGDVASTLSAGVEMFLGGGSLPHVFMVLAAPQAVSAILSELFHDQILEFCRQRNIDLAADAKKLADAEGRPWDLAPMGAIRDSMAAHSARTDLTGPRQSESRTAETDLDAALRSWWAQASKPENVRGIFTHLPDAWDGALNFQLSAGNIRMFDTGPRPIRYSSIGTIEEK
jgi:hypothetical protein